MEKKVPTNVITLQLEAGKATPAPPVGTVLGPTGINMQDFCTQYNERTRDNMGNIIPCVISIFEDRTFNFILKQPPAAYLLKKAVGISKGSSQGANETVATISVDKLKEVAESKMPDLNAYDVDAAMKILAGTAKNMGIVVEGLDNDE
ncbi:MAG: 50S ribosomal protein L11 [Bacilli bacterium]